jgi:hypothetical protein
MQNENSYPKTPPVAEHLRTALDIMQSRRLAGDFHGAMQQFDSLAVSGALQHPEVMAAGIPLLLLVNQNNIAVKLFSALCKVADPLRLLSPGVLVRLRPFLAGGALPGEAKLGFPDAPSWVRQWLDTGKEPALPAIISGIDIDCRMGAMWYYLNAGCPYCGRPLTVSIMRTLLIVKEIFCPECLGKYIVDYSIIMTYIRKRFPDLVDPSVYEREKWFCVLQEHIGGRGGEEVPLFIRDAGQDYVFYFNHIYWQHLSRQS